MKVKRHVLIHYILIYLMLIFNQSNLYQNFIFPNQILVVLITLTMLAVLVLRYKNSSITGTGLIALLLLFTAMERVFNGGTGIDFWCEIAIKIEIVYLAVLYDKENFIDRFIKLVYGLALVSIVFWGLQVVGINLARTVFYHYSTGHTYTIYDSLWNANVHHSDGYGVLIYSFLSFYSNRNIGIFTEPGIYQAVLNSSLFCIVYFSNQIKASKKRLLRMFIIISIAVITSQSTSGYFGLLAILVVMLLRNNKDSQGWKIHVIRIIMFAIFALGIDYSIRGSQSIISTAVLSKVFNSSNRFSLLSENSTGIWRFATLTMAILAMIRYPLGLGVDGFDRFMSSNPYAGPGGWPFRLGAILGVIPLIIAMIWIFRPIKNLKKESYAIVLYIFLYFNTSIAQTSAFYPALIMIPVYLFICNKYANKRKKDKYLE